MFHSQRTPKHGLQAPGPKLLAEWRKRLELLACEGLGRARIGQFFDIVVEHPESLPAVQDLRACLARTSLQAHFIHSFKAAIQHRLLHAGAPSATCSCDVKACLARTSLQTHFYL